MVKSINTAITRGVSCNTDTLIGFRSTENINDCDALLISALNNYISSLERQLTESKVI